MNHLKFTSGFQGPGKYFSGLLRMSIFLVCFLTAWTFPALAADNEFSVKAPRARHSLLLDCASVDGFSIAVGERGHILISEDNGTSWNQADVPTRATLTGVFFLDRNLGWVVGHDQVILRTKDGGETWSMLYKDIEDDRPLFDVWFKDAKNGIAVGGYGLYLETADGGDTWVRSEFSPLALSTESAENKTPEDEFEEIWDFHFNQIIRSQNGHLYMAAEAGHVFRSDDDGKSWLTLPSPYSGSFFGCLPLKGDAVLIFGLRGHLFRSGDAGETWQQVDLPTQATLTRGLYLENGIIVLTGLGGTLLFSDDEGYTFTLKQQPNRQNILKSVKTNDGALVMVGAFGVKRINYNDLGIEKVSAPMEKDN